MKKLVTNNNDLLEIIEENGIKTVCGDRMDILISDADAEKIAAKPSAITDNTSDPQQLFLHRNSCGLSRIWDVKAWTTFN